MTSSTGYSFPYFYEIPLKRGCLANCNYCEKLHGFSKASPLSVLPLEKTFVGCNVTHLERGQLSSQTLRRFNTRLYSYYHKQDIVHPGQWVIDGLMPEHDLTALIWAHQQGVVQSLVLALRSGVSYSLVLSYLEEQQLNYPIYLLSEFSADTLQVWMAQTKRLYPSTAQSFQLAKFSSSVYSPPARVIKRRELKASPTLSLILQLNDEIKNLDSRILSRKDVELIQVSNGHWPNSPADIFIEGRGAGSLKNLAADLACGRVLGFFDRLPTHEEVEEAINSQRFEVKSFSSQNNFSFSVDRKSFVHSSFRFNDSLVPDDLLDLILKIKLRAEGLRVGSGSSQELEVEKNRVADFDLERFADEEAYQDYFPLFGKFRWWRKSLKSNALDRNPSLIFHLFVLLILPVVAILKSLSDFAYRSVYGTGEKINLTWLYWTSVVLGNRISHYLWVVRHYLMWSVLWPFLHLLWFIRHHLFWSVFWPLCYPVRKIFYYLEYKFKKNR